MRKPFVIFWIDADGFAFNATYTERASWMDAKRYAMMKIADHHNTSRICGWLIQEAGPEIISRFYNKGINAKAETKEIEAHLFAPPHLRKR